jgi:hypothetical protein
VIAPFLVGGGAAVVLAGLSAWLVYKAIGKHRRYRQLIDTRLTPIESLRPGLAKTEGRVRSLEEPLLSPMEGRDCVYYHFIVEEQRGGGKSAHWVTVVNDQQFIPFVLEDGRDEVEVDLYRAEVEMRHAARTNSGLFNSPPPRLEHVLQRRYGASTHGWLFNKTMKYSEVVIEEGDFLVALGEVRDRGRGPLRIGSGHETTLLVSDEHPQDLTSKYLWARTGYGIGAGTCLFGLLMVLVGATTWLISEATNPAPPRPAFQNPPPPRQMGQNPGIQQPNNPPQPAPGFMAEALQDLRGDDGLRRLDALRRLTQGPADPEQRRDYDAARADPGRRKEVAALIVEAMRRDNVARGSASRALQLWIVPGVVPDVLDELDRATPPEAVQLTRALGRSRDARAVPALVKQLKSKANGRNAREALEAIGPAATAGLVTALDDEANDRLAICGILGEVGVAEALPALQKLAAGDDQAVAGAAAKAAERIKERTR